MRTFAVAGATESEFYSTSHDETRGMPEVAGSGEALHRPTARTESLHVKVLLLGTQAQTQSAENGQPLATHKAREIDLAKRKYTSRDL